MVVPLQPQTLADLEIPSEVKISPDGERVVYSLSPQSRKQESITSSLWLATVGEEGSARQLTSGEYHDCQPSWSGNGREVYFLSDRASGGLKGGVDQKGGDGNREDKREEKDEKGVLSAIFSVNVENVNDGSSQEIKSITSVGNKKPISSLAVSPDGKFIAFLSPDEDDEEAKRRKEEKDDVKVFPGHEGWELNALRVLHVQTGHVVMIPLAGDGGQGHVTMASWRGDSKAVVVAWKRSPGVDAEFEEKGGGTAVDVVGIEEAGGDEEKERKGQAVVEVKRLARIPGAILEMVWSPDGMTVFFMAGYTLNSIASSWCVYDLDANLGRWGRYGYGKKNCVAGLKKARDGVFTLVMEGLTDTMQILGGNQNIYSEVTSIESWDVHGSKDDVTLVYTKSSVSEPLEVYSKRGRKVTKLSRHGEAIADLEIATCEGLLQIKAKDETLLDAVLATPRGSDRDKPRPTAVFVHGGPYYRTTNQFRIPIPSFAPYVLAAGYSILCPNYRGGSGRGEKFASQARGGVGTEDFDDVISIIQEAVERGMVDENKVIIGGWSQGGFLSYLATTRPDFRFKGAICGAGVTDWDTMSMTSDATLFEAELAGGAPWTSEASFTKPRHGSAVWHMEDVKTPVLILHGEDDPRVPVNQAKVFYRGCVKFDVPCEMALYPRESHMGSDRPPERAHFLDMLGRVRRFCDECLK